MSDYRIAVLDVGKTNKKLFVYDSALTCLNPGEPAATFPQLSIDGLLCDDMPSIHRWMLESLARAARDFPPLRAVSISAHGATLALLGPGRDDIFPGDAGLLFPVVSYENSTTPAEDAAFYMAAGASPTDLQRETGTPPFAWLLNHAKQLTLLASRFPQKYAKLTRVLMFPQYLGLLLTGQVASEATYPGCHGYLLDISGDSYSRVADALGVTDKLSPLPFRRNWETLGVLTPVVAAETGLSADTVVTLGVHDSNAALVPYFARDLADFVVQDSGTWVVTMCPCRDAHFDPADLGKEVLFNRSVYGSPVKTTIFRGGAEFDFYRTRVFPHLPRPSGIDLAAVQKLLSARDTFILPTVERGSGLFPDSAPRIIGVDTIFADPAGAWTAFDLSLAVQGAEVLRLAAGPSPSKVFIEGNIGRENPLYRACIASLFPSAEVSFGHAGGAPCGAAILAACALEDCHPEDLASRVSLDLSPVAPLALDPSLLLSYAARFLDLLDANSG